MAHRQLTTYLAALGAALLLQAPSHANTAPEEGLLPLQELRTFANVFNHIRSGYVKEIDDKTLLEHAIRGMLEGLDPHSVYLDASSFDDLQVHTNGEFGGLGIEVGMEDGFVKVIAPMDDTPAAKAGIEAGDLIVKIDSKPVKGMNISDAVEQMRGPQGSEIVLTIVREGKEQPFDVTLKRAVIKVRSVRSKMLEPGYAYIRIAQFQIDTGKEMRKQLNKLQQDNAPLNGIILDLRNNPGGVLQASIDVVDAFLDDGLIVYTKGKLPESQTQFEAQPGDLSNGAPIVVLINEGSASASEIVSGALQDHHRAVIMGTDSFGKGSVQSIVPITNERAIKLTTALYYTPNGHSIQAQGIRPDIVIEPAQTTPKVRRHRITEAELSGHLSNGNGSADRTRDERESSLEKSRELLKQDNQLFTALTVLKTLKVVTVPVTDTSPTPTAADLAHKASEELPGSTIVN